MSQLQIKSLEALRILSENKHTLTELAGKLSICRRHAQRILKTLSCNGYTVQRKMVGGAKYYWVAEQPDLFPAIFSLEERAELQRTLASKNVPLQSALYKMTQLTHIQLHLRIYKR